MRIHYDHQVFSLQNTGGNSRYHFELMRHLAVNRDVHQELFLGFHQSDTPFEDLAADNLHVAGWRSTFPPGGRRYIANEFLNNAYGASRGTFDIYHPTHHRYLPLVRTRRMIVTLHDCTQEKFPAEFHHNHRVLRYRKALFARADRIICISQASRHDLLRFYDIDPHKTRVVHHGFTRLERSPQAVTELRRHVHRDYVLYVGSRALYKNFRGLLRAFRDSGLHHSVDLLVLGGGPMSPDDQRLISSLGLSDAVVHIPQVTDALLAEAYAGAHLLAYPSWSEGFGFPPLEAMYLGCPVLVCNTASLPEVCSNAAFYFEKDQPESLREALLRAVSDDSARAQAIARGREVAAGFTWEKCAEKTLAVYRECL